MAKRRVVVTGLGMLSPVGNTVGASWRSILAGKSGIAPIRNFDVSGFSTQFAGQIKDFNVTEYMSAKEARKCDMFIQYGIAAAIQAVRHAELESHKGLNKKRVGVLIGSGIGGIGTIESNQMSLANSGPRRVSPFFIPASIVNMIAGHVSILYGFQGPNMAVATACTTGTHSIGLAARSIAYNDADVMVAGGAEAACTPLGVSGFSALRALSTRNEEPELASRPWDKARDGFVLGDGAGVMVLEEYGHAKRRGANILAELTGFGMSADAFHITRPPEGGAGAALAMKNALEDANCEPSDVDYINAHGTSTPVGDLEEILAIKSVLRDAIKEVSISSTKSMTGHLLGAAGAIEAIFTVLSITDQIAPPTINLVDPDEHCDVDLVASVAKKRKIKVALSNSFGFGGTNGTLVFQGV